MHLKLKRLSVPATVFAAPAGGKRGSEGAPLRLTPLLPPPVQSWVRQVAAWCAPLEPGRLQAAFRRLIDHELEGASSWLEESQDFHPARLLGVGSTLYRATSPARLGDEVEGLERRLLAALMGPGPAIFVSIRGPRGPESEKMIAAQLRRFLSEPTREHREVPEGLPIEHVRVWRRLLECHDLGQPLVGLYFQPHHVESGTELLGRRMLSSAFERRGHLRQLLRRDARYRRQVAPWLAQARPRVKAEVDQVVGVCTARWLRTSSERAQLMGWRPAASVEGLARRLRLPEQASVAQLADFCDQVGALHAQLATGVQSYWLKLMREASPPGRRALLRSLLQAQMLLNRASASQPEVLHGFRTLGLETPSAQALDYDRAAELRRVTTETLYGLGLGGERWVTEVSQELYQQHAASIEAGEAAARAAVADYPAVDFASLHADPHYLESAQALLRGPGKGRRRALERFLSVEPEGERRRTIEAHFQLLRGLVTDAALVNELNFSALRASERWPEGAWLGACSHFGNRSAGRSLIPESVLAPAAAAPSPTAPGRPTSVVFAGAGGRGPLFLGSFAEVLERLGDGALRVDEYVGASAGAVIAGLLAAGYGPQELLERMEHLDFSRSLDDFFALGGVSPGVRGIDRNGLFSTRTMYDLVYQAMSEKLGIKDRPILFKDLPTELKVPVIVVSSDLPPELRRELGIDEHDREWLLSKATTPYLDAVAAIVASGAPPPFFETPKLQLLRKVIDASGEPVFERYQVRLADGGTSNKRPYSVAQQEDAFLMTFACVNVDGDRKVTTVDLSCQEAERYVRLNRDQTRAKLGGLEDFLSKAEAAGYPRAILSFHMATEPEPIGILGARDADTQALSQVAQASGLALMDATRLRASIEGDRIGVDLPPWLIAAARFFPAPLGGADAHPSWLQTLTAAASSISAAKRLRPLPHNSIPRRTA